MTKKTTKKSVESLKQIPQAVSEAETRQFWQTHTVGEGLLAEPLEQNLEPFPHQTFVRKRLPPPGTGSPSHPSLPPLLYLGKVLLLSYLRASLQTVRSWANQVTPPNSPHRVWKPPTSAI